MLLPFLVLFWASFLPFFAAPSWDAVSKLSLDNYRYLGGFRPFWDAMQNSIILSTLTATVAMVLTSLVAWIVYKSRLPGSWILDFLAFVPITIPGIVMGMALILLYVAFPIPIYGTIWVLLIAYVTRFIPYGMRAASGSILQIHSELEEAAAASGASWWETFKRVTLPLLRPGLVGGVDLYLHRVVSGIFHFGLAGHRRKPRALDSAFHHVRAGTGDRCRGHRRVDDCYLAVGRGGIL